MVLTSKERLGPDKWPEITDQGKGTENIMKIVWAEKFHHW